MKTQIYFILFILFPFLSSITVTAQTANKYDFERIEDNSFLMEEAYNQEPGVIQHISTFQYMKDHTWAYSFTDEWPVPGQKHQLSATIPVLYKAETGFGDIALNYRYQVFLKDRTAFSPRFSLLIPTGNYRKDHGSGTAGYQIDLPFSFLASAMLATHYNLGITITPGAKNSDGTKSDLTTYNYGMSMIFLLSKTFNLMLEAVGNTTSIKSANLAKRNSNTFFINPGFRYAINFKSDLQIVPGLAIPIGLGPSKGESGVFVYLSFEHPLWTPK